MNFSRSVLLAVVLVSNACSSPGTPDGGAGGGTGTGGGAATGGGSAGGMGGGLTGPVSDEDWDGAPTATDCDDRDDRVYPGVSVACTAACGAGTRTCGANGAYSPCSCTPLCERTGAGTCYYVSAATGSDSNPGTFAAPFKTYLNFTYYFTPPATQVALQPGDVVYFLAGTYSNVYACCGGAADKGMYLRALHGTPSAPITFKAYPGQKVVLGHHETNPVEVFDSSNLVFEGLEVTDGYGAGVNIDTVDGLELRNNDIHDMRGDATGNDGTGVKLLSASAVQIHHNSVHDNYDRVYPGPDHRQQMIFFLGGNIRVHHNHVYESDGKSNGGVMYKHKASIAGGTYELDHNVIEQCDQFGTASGTPDAHIHHNLFLSSGTPWVADLGGPTQFSNYVFERNTIIGGDALSYDVQIGAGYGALGPLTYRENIVVTSGAYMNERFFIGVGHYEPDATYTAVVTGDQLFFGPNCYFNSTAALSFSLFGAGGNAGSVMDFAAWKSAGYDTGSIVADPMLDAKHAPGLAACKGFGHLAE